MASAVASAEGATCVWGETLVITHACSAFHFYPREDMLVAFAYWLWPCVCVSVCLCPSVTSRSSIEAVERIELLVLDNGHGIFLLHCVKRNFEKMKVLPSGNLSKTADLENFASTYRSSKRVVDMARESWTLRA